MKLLRKTPAPSNLLPMQQELFAADTTPAEKPLSPARPTHRLHVGNQILAFSLKRSARRTIGFLIDDAGLRVTAPRWVPVAEIENAIRDKQRWILDKLAARRERAAQRPSAALQWCDGATLAYLGGTLTLRLFEHHTASVDGHLASGELHIFQPAGGTEAQRKDLIKAWLQAQAREVFGQRLPLYAGQLGVTYASWTLSSATRQWGSCTADGRIRLNWRLIHFALPLIDYVVAHELAHRREMNHSPRFWSTVGLIFPDHANARKTLRLQAPATLPVF